MFSSDANNDSWRVLEKAFKREDFAFFAASLQTMMPQFRDSIDDLRLLFYIGAKLNKRYFMHALQYFDSWQSNPPDRAEYRISVFLYAIEHSIPDRDLERRIYMREEFCKKLGIEPPTAT